MMVTQFIRVSPQQGRKFKFWINLTDDDLCFSLLFIQDTVLSNLRFFSLPVPLDCIPSMVTMDSVHQAINNGGRSILIRYFSMKSNEYHINI